MPPLAPGAPIADGLAVRGAELTHHRAEVESWLQRQGCAAADRHQLNTRRHNRPPYEFTLP